MRTNADVILATLREDTSRLCDDCLGASTGIERHQVNALSRRLAGEGKLSRLRASCGQCGAAMKLVSALTGGVMDTANEEEPGSSDTAVASVGEAHDLWYWEGNIQARLVDWLETQGYHQIQAVDTASREAGVDIIATNPQQRTLWVTVKGWPQKSIHTQARHWFAGALLDIAFYWNDADESRDLAIAFPDGFITYQRLLEKTKRIRKVMGFRVFLISGKGAVREYE